MADTSGTTAKVIDADVLTQVVWMVRQATANAINRAGCVEMATNLLRNHGYVVVGGICECDAFDGSPHGVGDCPGRFSEDGRLAE